MKKSDKKTENLIIQVLTQGCEQAKDEVTGFSWLTHQVNYTNFPNSLVVTCMFATEQQLIAAQTNNDTAHLSKIIIDQLASLNIKLKQPKKQIIFTVAPN